MSEVKYKVGVRDTPHVCGKEGFQSTPGLVTRRNPAALLKEWMDKI